MNTRPPTSRAAGSTGLINGERLTVLGWGRAILLQVAHPLIAAGVADHSGFRQGPVHALARLRSTVGAMLAISLGDDAARGAAIAGIRRIHDRVHGRLASDVGTWTAGTAYSAHDPDLLLWVHATLLDSILRTYRDLVAPLDAVTCDAYVAAAAEGLASLGLPAERTPRTADAIERMVATAIAGDVLAVSPAAREIATAIVSPPATRVVPVAASTQRLLTVGTLPPRLREMYGFAWTPADDRRLRRAQAVIRRLRAVSPAFLARFAAART